MRYLILSVAFIMMLLAGCAKTDDDVLPLPPTGIIDTLMVAQISIVTENSMAISSKDNYINCSVTVKSNDKVTFTGSGQIRGRGNSSWHWYPKKPFRIKLDEKASLLGLKSDKDWVLLANYRDPTHLMNTFALTMGQHLGLPYTNHVRYVEVTLNGSYIGLYLLTEQVEQGKSRVAIDSVAGVLICLDADDGPHLSPGASDNFWSSVYQLPVCVKSPDITSPEQLATIKDELAKLEAAIKSGNYSTIDKLFDIKSFIDFLLIQELVYNVEVDAPRSMFMHRDLGGKWTMGPLWDFDAGFDFDWGTMYTGHNYFDSYKQLVLGTDPVNHKNGYWVNAFFTDLFKNKQFVTEYKARWLVLKDKVMANYWKATQLYADNFAEAMERNNTRWPIDKNYITETQRLQQWLNNRVAYLTTVIANYPAGTK